MLTIKAKADKDLTKENDCNYYSGMTMDELEYIYSAMNMRVIIKSGKVIGFAEEDREEAVS